MRDRNGYVCAKLVGATEQSKISKQYKTTVSFPHELKRVDGIMNHQSTAIDQETRASMSLVLRRALVLLEQHQSTLVKPLDIAEEILLYKWIAKTGYESKLANPNYRK